MRLTLALILAIFVSHDFNLSAARAEDPLPRATPESQGIASDDIRLFIEKADKEINAMHSFMLLRHGNVVAEAWWSPESADKPHVLWSLSKSFTSTAVGLAIAEGKLGIDDPVIKFFPDQTPAEPSAHLKAMRVRDLLTMSTGHAKEAEFWNSGPTIEGFLTHPVPHKPGTHFVYNTPATYMQSAIVQKVTGQTVLDYLEPRLFEPLGIEDPKWDQSSEKISLGGYGLHLRTEEIAKFGQLLLQKGIWKGKPLVPEDWVEQATSKQVSNGDNPQSDWSQGYGYQLWRSRNNAFRGDGKDGQFCVVIPEHDAVVIMTANSDNMQAQLDLVWSQLLPAFKEGTLPENKEAAAKLDAIQSKLTAGR